MDSMVKIDCQFHHSEDFKEEWDRFVERCPEATFYHLFGWRHVLQRTFGFKPYYLAHYSGGKMDGILPLFLMTDILGRRYLVSNPFANFAGVCATNASAVKNLLREAKALGEKLGVQYVELRQLDQHVKFDLPVRDRFVTLYLELPGDAEAAWKDLSSRNRGKIRKAIKAGLTVHVGKKYVKDFFAVYSENITRLGTPIFPLRFFQNLLEVFPEETDILVLKLDGRPVAGMFLFKFKEVISEPWVSTLRSVSKIYANNFLYWKAIEYACQKGFRWFDFGRSTINTGTYTYKIRWGAKPRPLYYYYLLVRGREIPQVDAVDNKYEVAISLWKRLPIGLARYAGPLLVKYLPEL
jgi:FemAB-related protein (PEP-CTERM system-associated)